MHHKQEWRLEQVELQSAVSMLLDAMLYIAPYILYGPIPMTTFENFNQGFRN